MSSRPPPVPLWSGFANAPFHSRYFAPAAIVPVKRTPERPARRWFPADLAGLFSSSAIVFGVRFGAAFITYATQVLLANWMGAGQLGVLVYAMAWLWILNVISVMGLGSAASRFLPQYRSAGETPLARGFVRFSRQIVTLFGVGIGVLGITALLLTGPPRATGEIAPLVVALAVLPFIAVTTIQSGIARACLWFTFAAVTGMLLRPLLLLAGIAGAFALGVAPSATGVMLLLGAIIVVVCAYQLVALRRRLAPQLGKGPSKTVPRLWLRVAVPIVLAELFVNFFIDINVILSGGYLDAAQIAVFNAALRTVAIMAFGLSAVGAVVAPHAARLHAEGDLQGLQHLMRSAAHLMLWPSLLALGILVVLGKTILGFFGEEFVAGFDVLLIGGLAQVLMAAAGPLLPVLNVAGYQDRCIPVFASALVLAPLLYWWLVPAFGMTGGAIALLAISAMWTVWLYAIVRRHLGIRPSPFDPARVFSEPD